MHRVLLRGVRRELEPRELLVLRGEGAGSGWRDPGGAAVGCLPAMGGQLIVPAPDDARRDRGLAAEIAGPGPAAPAATLLGAIGQAEGGEAVDILEADRGPVLCTGRTNDARPARSVERE